MSFQRVFILVPIFFLLSFSHKFYVSLVEINHNPSDSILEITMKIFTDDLENTILEKSGINLKLGTKEEYNLADSIIFRYIVQKFEIGMAAKALPLRYIGKEVDMDVTWIYLQVDDISSLSTLKITDRMLTEIFDNQTNLINVIFQGIKKGLLLTKNAQSGLVKF